MGSLEHHTQLVVLYGFLKRQWPHLCKCDFLNEGLALKQHTQQIQIYRFFTDSPVCEIMQ